MAEKFPALANAVIAVLREFLVHPSPVLDRLSRHCDEVNKNKVAMRPVQGRTQSADRQDTPRGKSAMVNKITDAFLQLRDVAMKNVCV